MSGAAMVIAVDAMGGDNAPGQIVAGAVLAAPDLAGEIVLVGRESQVRALLAEHGALPPNVRVQHADDVVEMDDNPMLALRQKAGSSVTLAVDLVRDGQADAVVSAGNSGALMAAATMRLGRLPGVARPGIAVFMPTPLGKRICLDAGANVDCKPEHLLAYAIMGSQYAEHALGIENPRVGLLSIGTEPCKGNDLTLATAALLQNAPINFVGNVEGTQIFEGAVDVTVCDGFVGNVVLKVAEGVGHLVLSELKKTFRTSWRAMLGAWIMKSELKRMARQLDYAEYGGALLLGVSGVCVVSHGKSDARAIANAIGVAAAGAESRVVQRMAECLSALPAPVQVTSG